MEGGGYRGWAADCVFPFAGNGESGGWDVRFSGEADQGRGRTTVFGWELRCVSSLLSALPGSSSILAVASRTTVADGDYDTGLCEFGC